MFILVRLLNGFNEPLWYKMPDSWNHDTIKGSFVTVPLRNKEVKGIVVDFSWQLPPHLVFKTKDAIAQEVFPKDSSYQLFISKLAYYYCIDSIHFLRRLQSFLSKETIGKQLTPVFSQEYCAVNLTSEQNFIVTEINPAISKGIFNISLLHGVTGSGKTEVYKKLIESSVSQGKTAILLLPEVTLALQFEHLLKLAYGPKIQICGFHSATSTKEKRFTWQALMQQMPIVIVGVHLPILLPIANLGIIIVDEEHSNGYQEKKHPKINSKEAALIRAQSYSIPILLGSATPSVTSLHNVHKRSWRLFSLKNRFEGAFPKIEIINLRETKSKCFWISNQLRDAIKSSLAKKEQVILFLNRRGYSFFVQCKQCSFIFNCISCSVSLTLHNDNKMYCHYCNYIIPMPIVCTSCKSNKLLKKGVGTQQIVSILRSLFPAASIARADLDTTKKKKEWMHTVDQFNKGDIDIIVGTQTITKGFHFPNVTLVGIIWADLNLHIPFYNATEIAIQQFIQVAGRAGRQRKDSLVIVQSMSNYPVLKYLAENSYSSFYNEELHHRREVGYPPFIRFAELELRYEQESIVEREAVAIMEHLAKQSIFRNSFTVLGPAKPPVHKLKNVFMRTIYIKAVSMETIIDLYGSIQKKKFTSQLFFNPNPI